MRGVANTDKLNYRVESQMGFILKGTEFKAEMPLLVFIQILKQGLEGGICSLKFGDIEGFEAEVVKLRQLEVNQVYLVQITEEEGMTEL